MRCYQKFRKCQYPSNLRIALHIPECGTTLLQNGELIYSSYPKVFPIYFINNLCSDLKSKEGGGLAS